MKVSAPAPANQEFQPHPCNEHQKATPDTSQPGHYFETNKQKIHPGAKQEVTQKQKGATVIQCTVISFILNC